MRKALILAIALLAELIFSACSATFRVKQPGGTEMSYHGPANQATTAMNLPPVIGPSNAYTRAMSACAEAVKQNPGATYIVNADGGCTFIGDQNGIRAYEAIWENTKSFDIFVVIASVRDKNRVNSFFVKSGQYTQFYLLPDDYVYEVINPANKQIINQGRFTADGFTQNSYSQMARRSVSFRATTGNMGCH